MLLSRLLKNLPRILIAITRKPLSASISSTVMTVSYRMEFPTFLDESVFVATCMGIERLVKIHGATSTRRTHLCKNVVHCLAC